MDSEQRKRMAEKSGANNSAPKYSVPFIQFDGRNGTFKKVSYKDNEKVEEDLKKPVEFVILKKRRTLSSFKPSYFTTEHNKATDKVMLFKSMKTNGKVSVTLDSIGFANELREKNPILKTHEIVYVLMDGEVCKMEIKSGSIMDYYAFQKSYGDEELHGFEITTKVTSVEAENDSGSYYKMVFSFIPNIPKGTTFDLIEQKMDEVSANLDRMDEYTKNRIDEKNNSQVSGNKSNLSDEEISQIKALREKAEKDFNNFNNEDGNNEDIPF